ncbi:hypothetical protein ACOME3_001730 [Neoechinorhynchus agilis]
MARVSGEIAIPVVRTSLKNASNDLIIKKKSLGMIELKASPRQPKKGFYCFVWLGYPGRSLFPRSGRV